jgi:hypothetical protein
VGGGNFLIKKNRMANDERSQHFICTHNETLSLIAVRVNNPDRSPARIDG